MKYQKENRERYLPNGGVMRYWEMIVTEVKMDIAVVDQDQAL